MFSFSSNPNGVCSRIPKGSMNGRREGWDEVSRKAKMKIVEKMSCIAFDSAIFLRYLRLVMGFIGSFVVVSREF